MSFIVSAMDIFWEKFVKTSDQKRLAKQTEPENIERVCDIPYIDDGNRYHQFDVYYPQQEGVKFPVIIDVHGGGWMYGDKELNKMYCLHLAKRGFAVFNISYTLHPTATVNDQIKEVMQALKVISETMEAYPCDTNNIMLTGDSAGGQLAVYAAALLSSEKLRGIFETVDPEMKLKFLLLTSPVSYMNADGIMGVYTRKMWGDDYKAKRTYPYMNLDSILPFASFPPTLMVTSSGDFMAHNQTKNAARDFESNGFKVELMDFPKFEGKDLPHVFSVCEPESKPGKMVIERAVELFRKGIETSEKVN